VSFSVDCMKICICTVSHKKEALYFCPRVKFTDECSSERMLKNIWENNNRQRYSASFLWTDGMLLDVFVALLLKLELILAKLLIFIHYSVQF